ncbi:hypothetical protein SNOG_04129 [Parastagonospora nodorum SN15]|uniref:Uncharacterized protein n=1 Tax=Phaeosphaeria nodorum (strain SN15 / ATCC MYA-4574 / FGSC 10173) TaxID=321614 RepID=Q0UVT5_PHANO|nr:hypothetical protein SNOG_04129 [Parastagonospora nodorum SN15]EAT87889.1 hypothetical protein SNOG_04129 [Parastagonospora nodorum SN15]
MTDSPGNERAGAIARLNHDPSRSDTKEHGQGCLFPLRPNQQPPSYIRIETTTPGGLHSHCQGTHIAMSFGRPAQPTAKMFLLSDSFERTRSKRCIHGIANPDCGMTAFLLSE